MTDELRTRLKAVERAVTDDEADLTALADAATVDERLTAVEGRLDEVETRLADLDATTQAIRGYLSGVDGVAADVERQAALALAKAEAVEAHVFEADDGLSVERLSPTEDDSQTAAGASDDSQDNSDSRNSPDNPVRDDGRVTVPPGSGSSLVTRLRDVL